jgi:hypothetical protein
MTPKQLHDYFRSQQADVAEPYLWTSDEVYNYMDEAHKMFVRLIGGIPDSSTVAVTEVNFVANDAFAPLDPRVLEVTDASRESDGVQIDVFNIEDFKHGNASFVRRDEDYYFYDGIVGRGPTIKWRTRTGTPVKGVILGMQRNQIRAYPIPTEDQTVLLDVHRLPLFTLTRQNHPDFVFEIDEIHHRYLAWWMQYLAFQKHDADTYSKTYSELYEGKFMGYCQKIATAEQERRKRKPRTVQYGGL